MTRTVFDCDACAVREITPLRVPVSVGDGGRTEVVDLCLACSLTALRELLHGDGVNVEDRRAWVRRFTRARK